MVLPNAKNSQTRGGRFSKSTVFRNVNRWSFRTIFHGSSADSPSFDRDGRSPLSRETISKCEIAVDIL